MVDSGELPPREHLVPQALAVSANEADSAAMPGFEPLESQSYHQLSGSVDAPRHTLAGSPPGLVRHVAGGPASVSLRVTQDFGDMRPEVVEEVAAIRVPTLLDPAADEPGPFQANEEEPAIGPAPGERVRDESGREFVYVRFSPEFDRWASDFVDWSDPEAQVAPRAAIRSAEALRQEVLQAQIRRSMGDAQPPSGCEFAATSRSANAAWFWCSPDDALSFAAHEGVQRLDYARTGTTSLDGSEQRAATAMQTGHLISQGWDGEQAPPAGTGRSDIVVSLIDPQGFHRVWEHPAFNDSSGASTTRILSRRRCTSGTCFNDTSADSGPEDNHGSRIITPFADYEDNQSLAAGICAFTGQCPSGYSCVSGLCQSNTAISRPERSYHAPEAYLRTLWANYGSIGAAIEDAVLHQDGTDLIVISAEEGICGSTSSVAAVRDAWNLAYSHGAIGFLSAMNGVNEHDDLCRANAFATRPDLVVVGGYGSHTRVTNSDMFPSVWATPTESWDADTEDLMGWHWTDMTYTDNCPFIDHPFDYCWSSSIGGQHLYVGGATTLFASAVIDLTAPSAIEFAAVVKSGRPQFLTQPVTGTSISAPIAAAGAVSLLDWAYDSSYTIFENPGIFHVNLMLLGDGTRGGHRPGGPPTGSYTGLDRLWGAGRMKLRVFNEYGMDWPWSWGTGWLDMTDNQVVDLAVGPGPFSADKDIFRLAMSWDEPFLYTSETTNAAQISIRVVTTSPVGGVCSNPGGSGGTVVASDTSYDTQKLITIRGSTISSLHNKCVWMRFTATDIPNNGSPAGYRRVYRADYHEDLDRELDESLADID